MEINRIEALSTRIDVIASNLANAQTQAFKRRRTDVNTGPENKITQLPLDMTQGALESTGGNLDLAITGDGFFCLKIAPNVGDGNGYTRNGALALNRRGDLIVSIGSGYELIPPVNIPPGATNILISLDGTVTYLNSTSKTTTAGQIMLNRFINPAALEPQVQGIYLETADSGQPLITNPGDSGTGTLQQGFLEASNVDPIKESVALMKAEQMLQLSTRSFQVVDQARQAVANLDR